MSVKNSFEMWLIPGIAFGLFVKKKLITDVWYSKHQQIWKNYLRFEVTILIWFVVILIVYKKQI